MENAAYAACTKRGTVLWQIKLRNMGPSPQFLQKKFLQMVSHSAQMVPVIKGRAFLFKITSRPSSKRSSSASFDKGVHALLREQIPGDALDLLGRAAVEGGDGGGIADFGGDGLNVLPGHMFEFRRLGEQDLPALPEHIRIPRILHIQP